MTKLVSTCLVSLLLVSTGCGKSDFSLSALLGTKKEKSNPTPDPRIKSTIKIVVNGVVQSFDEPGIQEIVIPQDATDVSYVVIGGAGGSSGTSLSVDSRVQTVPANVGGRGLVVEGSFKLDQVRGKTLKLYIAGDGESGMQSAEGGARGGRGGSGFFAGGDGGAAGNKPVTWTQSTGGGGGGGASAITLADVVLVVAGGGGGAGGAAFTGFQSDFCKYNPHSLPVNPGGSAVSPSFKNLGKGQPGRSVAEGISNSGGGGGGGGMTAGLGGAAIDAGNHSAGCDGKAGGSFVNDLFVTKSATDAT